MTVSSKAHYRYGFQLVSELVGCSPVSLPVTSATAITKGDLVYMSSGYLTVLSEFDTGGLLKAYVALDTNTVAEAVANGTVECRCVPITWPARYTVPVGANTKLVQATHVGHLCAISGSTTGAMTITNSSSVTANSGFLIEEIDISAPAIASFAYGMAIGRFNWVAETT